MPAGIPHKLTTTVMREEQCEYEYEPTGLYCPFCGNRTVYKFRVVNGCLSRDWFILCVLCVTHYLPYTLLDEKGLLHVKDAHDLCAARQIRDGLPG